MLATLNEEFFGSAPLSSNANLFERYVRMRKISSELLSKKILKCSSRNALMDCGKKLGIAHRKTLVFNTAGDLNILMDYAIFHYYINGKNAIDRYVLTKPQGLSDEEQAVLFACAHAEYSFLIVDKVLPHGGVIVKNVFRGKIELLIDKGISESCFPKVGLVTTLLRFPDFIMTTGCAIPVNNIVEDLLPLIEDYLDKDEEFQSISKTHQSQLITNILKMCLRKEVTENIRYNDAVCKDKIRHTNI